MPKWPIVDVTASRSQGMTFWRAPYSGRRRRTTTTTARTRVRGLSANAVLPYSSCRIRCQLEDGGGGGGGGGVVGGLRLRDVGGEIGHFGGRWSEWNGWKGVKREEGGKQEAEWAGQRSSPKCEKVRTAEEGREGGLAAVPSLSP